MPTSRSDFVRIRGLRYHVRRWGAPDKPLLILGHGLLDASATFENLVQPLLDACQVVAPDWRGLGYTEWPADGYWFADYVADLDALVDHYAGTDAPIRLVGHSMGAQIVSLYAGLKPSRVEKLVVIDGLASPDAAPEQAPERYRRWLRQLRMPMRAKTYASFAALAERVRVQHPQLSEARALFVARGWGCEDGRGRVRLLADPRHRLSMPALYRAAESKEIWKQITAPTLFVDGGASPFMAMLSPEERAARRACFARREETVIDGAGHMLHFDRPQQTGERLAAFLRD
ncbi:alpha/beta fold hydrolase [Solimonas soli]|uniref:alpha/beta fold hydrolase n=1 Tax=Solimonas soli TaxID=413479 RepID=UPI000486E88A|nr:alpha/beta hydrolase [Solimonas soli]